MRQSGRIEARAQEKTIGTLRGCAISASKREATTCASSSEACANCVRHIRNGWCRTARRDFVERWWTSSRRLGSEAHCQSRRRSENLRMVLRSRPKGRKGLQWRSRVTDVLVNTERAKATEASLPMGDAFNLNVVFVEAQNYSFCSTTFILHQPMICPVHAVFAKSALARPTDYEALAPPTDYEAPNRGSRDDRRPGKTHSTCRWRCSGWCEATIRGASAWSCFGRGERDFGGAGPGVRFACGGVSASWRAECAHAPLSELAGRVGGMGRRLETACPCREVRLLLLRRKSCDSEGNETAQKERA